jgi:ATP-dependent DNA ligase
MSRSASQAVKSGPSRGGPLPLFAPPQLSQLVEKPPSGPQWVHEIKFMAFAWPRASIMAACNS